MEAKSDAKKNLEKDTTCHVANIKITGSRRLGFSNSEARGLDFVFCSTYNIFQVGVIGTSRPLVLLQART